MTMLRSENRLEKKSLYFCTDLLNSPRITVIRYKLSDITIIRYNSFML